MKTILFTLFLSFSFQAFALVQVDVVYGDRQSQFLLDKVGNKAELKFKSNEVGSKIKQITHEDYEYFEQRVLSLPKQSNDIHFCPRKYIQMTVGQVKKAACIGSQTKIATEIDLLVQLLRIQI